MSLFGSFWKKDSENTRKASSSGKWQVGDKIANRYEIHQILGGEGKSGLGIVYVCYDYKTKFICALKTFQEKYFLSEKVIKLFEREALIWTELERYPYIVRSYFVEELEGSLFIVLEYIGPDSQGRNTLAHYLENLTSLDILKFSIQFCYGMEYAYSKGIDCHRDIKPDNIMITLDKTVKITDFGLAKAFQEIQLKEDIISEEENPSLSIFQSKGKRICGTLPYMAPEQFDGYADKRSDIYAFGIVLYQMVNNGRLPFIGITPEEYEKLHKYEVVPEAPSFLFPIIQKCLEKSPDKRYQDFASIREELQRFSLVETGERITPPERKELELWELYNKGLSLSRLGKYEEAIFCYDKAIEIEPRDVHTWHNKGHVLGCLARYEEAIACYDKALDIDPTQILTWSGKGLVFHKLGKDRQALNCYEKAIELNPRSAEYWHYKGVILRNLGRNEEAISCCDNAIKITPKYASAWNNKGDALLHLGRYEEAALSFDKAIEIEPKDATVWYNKGLTLGNLGRYEEEIFCYDKALNIRPKYASAWNNKGYALECLKRYKEALQCYDEALKAEPNHVRAKNNKENCLKKLRR